MIRIHNFAGGALGKDVPERLTAYQALVTSRPAYDRAQAASAGAIR